MSKCKTYRLPRCQPQAIIQQSKQKERLSIFIHPGFHVASEALTFVFQCIPDEGQGEELGKETFVEEVDENYFPCFDKPFRQAVIVSDRNLEYRKVGTKRSFTSIRRLPSDCANEKY
jgi:hypothetical protein